jgi:hypothetical protein
MQQGGQITGAIITAPATAHAGSVLNVTIDVATQSPNASPRIFVYPRLSTADRRHLLPSPKEVDYSPRGPSERLSFAFPLPSDILPHGCSVKAIIASSLEAAFVSRPIFIVPATAST